jgi:hypothetical protein
MMLAVSALARRNEESFTNTAKKEFVNSIME